MLWILVAILVLGLISGGVVAILHYRTRKENAELKGRNGRLVDLVRDMAAETRPKGYEEGIVE